MPTQELRLRLSHLCDSPSSSPGRDRGQHRLPVAHGNGGSVSPTPGGKDNGLHHRSNSALSSNGIGTPSSSFDELQAGHMTSQSLHNALHPPQTSPSKRHLLPRPPLFKRMIPKVLKAKYSTFFVFGTFFAIGSIRRLHHLAEQNSTMGESASNVHQWNAPHNLRQKRRLGRHPRVIHVSNIHTGSIREYTKFNTFWGRFISAFPSLRRRAQIHDEMLHHDGWTPKDNPEWLVPSNDNEEDATTTSTEEGETRQQCVPMAEWQTTSYPNCNTVHEIDMVRSSGPGSYAFPKHSPELHCRRRITSHPPKLHKAYKHYLKQKWTDKDKKKQAKLAAGGIVEEELIEFLGQGWFRQAWEMYQEGVPDYDSYDDVWGFDESVVLKTLRIEREFLEEYYELHRRDALAMERLTFSPYVLDIYGYCGQSAINELANFGIEGMSSLEKVARSFRGMENIEPVSKIRLQLASMVATGVSHMHSIDYPDFPEHEDWSSMSEDEKESVRKEREGRAKVRSNATLVHYDLNPRNIAIIRKGKPKLNDFNVAEFLTWDAKNGKTCGFPGRFREPWWRAPEEMHFHMSNYTNPAPLTEKIDIYALGNILWDILTSHSPRGKMTKELEDKTRPEVARGDMPKWPEDFNRTKVTTDPALMAIEKAVRKCLRYNPEDRPTAGEIADELSEAIDNLPEGFGDKEKWRAMRNQKEGGRVKSSQD